MDCFKLVATMEKRGVYFTLVPHKWEKNKELYWPEHLKAKEREILRKNPASEPDDILWKKYKCIVKLNNIETFDDGIRLEKQFSECSDTEAEEILLNKVTKEKDSEIQNRNYMFEDNINIDSINVLQNEDGTIIFPAKNLQNEIFVDNTVIENASIASLDEFKNEFVQFKEDIKKDITDLKIELKTDVIKILTYLDKINKKIDNIDPVVSVGRENNEISHSFNIFPLKCEEDIQNVELKIRSDEKYKLELIEYLSQIGGNSGQNDGFKIGYKIVDHVFTPQVLTNYSWTGVSRGQKSDKKCFQNFQSLLDIFYQVIFLADNRHTKQKNSLFFKEAVLKHAKKRSLRKRVLQIDERELPENNALEENIQEVDDHSLTPAENDK